MLKGKVVLILEDDSEMRSIFKEELTAVGAEVLEAPNGVVGFQMIKSFNVDIVVSDLNMPDGDGLEFCRKVKALPGKKPKILLCSGQVGLNATMMQKAGATRFIFKPFDMLVLIKTIAVALRDEAA